MGLWAEQVVPRATDVLLSTREVRRYRAAALEGASGELVEIGFGSGLNVDLYPSSVRAVHAVDPSEVGRRLAARRLAASRVPVEFAGSDAEAMALEDASMDGAISTFTLCTVPHADGALAELYRALKPGGKLHFLEHGLSPDPGTARWQHRLSGLQRRVAAGCNLDRPIEHLVRSAGFSIERLENGLLDAPRPFRPWGYLYYGVAAKPEPG